jgi:DNA-binding CsgD family transcriptional regulator
MLLGREEERLALDRLLGEARGGRSGALALVGEPGIGKTALLDYAAERADGMHVLRARGIESEAEVPFAGLAEILRPALAALERIPKPQARALGGALALEPATAQDRFAIGAATLSLLSAYAEEAPLLVIVDDAHLLDASSAEALLFAARRLVADPIAVVLAVREGEPSLLDGADLRVLRIAGLDRSDAAELLGLAPDAVDRLFRATGGNPLALLELAPDAARLADLPAEGPIPLSASIAASFVRRLDRLPEPTRRILLLVSASDTGDVSVLARAAAATGLVIEDLTPAEEAGLIALAGGRVEYAHPLARSAVYAAAAAQERRDAHGALAAALPDRDVDRRAWHLAAAAVGPDAQAAAALEQAGARARERSAYAASTAAFERGGRLAPSEELRAKLLFAAAESASLAGDSGRALRLLDEADLAGDPVLAARILYLRGEVTMRRGPVMDGYPLIRSAAEQIAEVEPELAVEMLARAAYGCFYAGDTPALVSAAERAVALAEGQDSRRAGFFAALSHAFALVARGEGEAGASAARRAVEIIEGSEELRNDPLLLTWAALGPLWLREAQAGRALIERASELARGQAAVGALPGLLHILARDQATTDQWAAAEASLDEAIRLARETGQRVELAAALAGLACLEARRGREDVCRRYAAEARAACAELGMGTYGIWTIQALGDLELGLGRPGEAAAHHEEQLAAMSALRIADVDLSPGPELVESYLRLGRTDDAAAAAGVYDAAALAKGQPWALARAARCRGMLADEFEPHFGEALRLHGLTPDLFEAARTQLAYGARLRRSRQRVRAREELRTAFESFESLGAESWAEQARAELAATGETARRRDVSTLGELTPQELQIARLLADGRTTREAAAAVFLSPKTVEYHLRNVYRKLGIHSRDELAETLR